jgi:lipopolysaccharide biosynthesis glycosyltransferase
MNLAFFSVEDEAAEKHTAFEHITTPSLLKLRAVASLVSQYDRVVYLDYDFLAFKKLKIEELDFGGYPVAAVTDMDMSHAGALRNRDVRDPSSLNDALGYYFNAGFMVFNSAAWRPEFLDRYQATLDAHVHHCGYIDDCTTPDQCALNTIFANNWRLLPADYNMQAAGKFTKTWQTAAVRHYCGPRKCLPLSPLRSDYRDTRQLNAIHALLGRPTSQFALVYDLLFRVNCLRNYRRSAATRNLLAALDMRFSRIKVTSAAA